MAPKKIRNVIQKLKLELRKAGFPSFRVVLFGSYARGEERKDSDIDICLISSAFKVKGKEEKFRREAVFIAFQIDPRIQIVMATPERLKDVLSPLFSRVHKEGIAA